ncbi:MAG: hypothetical protein IKR86_02050 [Candidatus Methanomethylophilaceae archaeon]|nr:hypothetical protein [Candidatus Methanomethylophilaceae archaeon]
MYVGDCDDIVAFEVDNYARKGQEVLCLLLDTGWVVNMGEVRIKDLHNAKEGDPLARFILPGPQEHRCDVVADRSTGIMESEMEGSGDSDLVRIYSNIPSAVKAMGDRVDAVERSIEGLGEDNYKLRARDDALELEVVALRQEVSEQRARADRMSTSISALLEGMAKSIMACILQTETANRPRVGDVITGAQGSLPGGSVRPRGGRP